MTSPFAVHAKLNAQYQEILGGTPCQRGLQAVITIIGVAIPCTITPILYDFEIEAGRSMLTFVEECEFLVSDGPQDPQNNNNKLFMKKGINAKLNVSSSVPAGTPNTQFNMTLWRGGMMPGGLIWRFSLVDASYKG